MDIDDPWGSPWADERQIPSTNTEQKSEAANSAAPAKASAIALEETTSSPWGEEHDDSFGAWATLPPDIGHPSGVNGTTELWTRTSSQTAELDIDKTIDPTGDWNGSHAANEEYSTSFKPGMFPESAEDVRQPSQDLGTNTAPIDEGVEDTSTTAGYLERNEDFLETAKEARPQAGASSSGIFVAAQLSEGKDAGLNKATTDDEHPESIAVESVGDLFSPENDTEPSFVASNHNGEPTMSRPSSSTSERSRHEELPLESPRTSVDEEPRRPPVQRKVSTKIQELVQHFDGMAKLEDTGISGVAPESADTAVTPTSDGTEGISPARKEAEDKLSDKNDLEHEEDDEFGDFGDFEEGLSDADEWAASEGPSTFQSQPQDILAEEVGLRQAKKDSGPVEFIIDTAAFDSIWPCVEMGSSADCPYIPDTAPYESFSSVEERKLWYRISRYGAMRKHNAGDDENYLRVRWNQSAIQDETLKIVGKWMEEDRMSGRVVLGGGSKGSSVFGWNDSKVAPVDLSRAFAAKSGKKKVPATDTVEIPREWPKGLVRDRSTSKSRSLSKVPCRSSLKSSKVNISPEGDHSAPKEPAASFGWSTAPGAGSVSSLQKPTSDGLPTPVAEYFHPIKPISPPRESMHLSRPPSMEADSKPNDLFQPIATITATLAQPVTASPKTGPMVLPDLAAIVLPEDEWGEMISSPVISTPPILPATKGLRHKRSQSSGGDTPPTVQHPQNPQISALQSGVGHRANMSSDDFLTLAPSQVSGPVSATSSVFDAFERPSSTPSGNPSKSTPSLSVPATTLANADLGAAGSSPPTSLKEAPQPEATTITSDVDPWASADFSFFDSGPAPVQKTTPLPGPEPVTVKFAAPIHASKLTPNSAAKPAAAKSVSFVSLLPPTQTEPFQGAKKRDQLVQDIVEGLPDLSYMLR